jgi:hypothetical protein
MGATIINATGCPPSCGGAVVRALSGSLYYDDIPDPPVYMALDNIRDWVLDYDMTTIPWGRYWYGWFSGDGPTTPDVYQGLSGEGVGLPNSTYKTDAALPSGSAIYGFQRIQVLFSVPTNYMMLCVGWLASTGFYGYYDEGCAGTYGGACGVLEIPWSVIPSYPYVWLFLQGPTYPDAEIFPNLITLVDNTYGNPSVAAGPDWNASQTCGPAHCCDPFGQQLTAP